MPVTVRELASDERGQGSARLLEGVVSRTWSCGRRRSVRYYGRERLRLG